MDELMILAAVTPFAEIGYRFEIWHQAAGQPNQLDVALHSLSRRLAPD
jgi:hypothetical protein